MPVPFWMRRPDYKWHIRDREWEADLVAQVRRGVALHVFSVNDTCPSYYYESIDPIGGWEKAEEKAKNADRSKSVWLNDDAIAVREAERRRRREAYKATIAARAELAAKEKAKREEDEATVAAIRREAKDEREKEWARRREAEAEAFARREAARNERLEERRAEQARLDAIFKHDQDVRGILYAKWLCIDCNNVAMVEQENDGYVFTCLHCRKTVRGSHEQVMKARQK